MPKIIKSAKGSFTTADITIDGSGRVVTASSGQAGGGGGSGKRSPSHTPAVGGGAGGNALFGTPVSAPFSQPYSVGAGGTGGPCSYAAGSAGADTTLAGVGEVTGGGGGTGGSGSVSPTEASNGGSSSPFSPTLLFDYSPLTRDHDGSPPYSPGDFKKGNSTQKLPGFTRGDGYDYNTSQPGGSSGPTSDGSGGQGAVSPTKGSPGGQGWLLVFEDLGP